MRGNCSRLKHFFIELYKSKQWILIYGSKSASLIGDSTHDHPEIIGSFISKPSKEKNRQTQMND